MACGRTGRAESIRVSLDRQRDRFGVSAAEGDYDWYPARLAASENHTIAAFESGEQLAELRPRQRITRPLRQRNGIASRNSANHERPRQDWIEIPVPALISPETPSLPNTRELPRDSQITLSWICAPDSTSL